jgi:hypothetical protein
MKFFGYEDQNPSPEAIELEIRTNLLLEGVAGATQMLGVFTDSEEGYCTYNANCFFV